MRKALGKSATILVLHGIPSGSEPDFMTVNLVPVLNTLGQVDLWNDYAREVHRDIAAVLPCSTSRRLTTAASLAFASETEEWAR